MRRWARADDVVGGVASAWGMGWRCRRSVALVVWGRTDEGGAEQKRWRPNRWWKGEAGWAEVRVGRVGALAVKVCAWCDGRGGAGGEAWRWWCDGGLVSAGNGWAEVRVGADGAGVEREVMGGMVRGANEHVGQVFTVVEGGAYWLRESRSDSTIS